MSKTIENLKAAFAGESQANRRYLAFAKAAQKEGKPGLAKLFRVTAEGETVHALNHLNAMAGVKSTQDNLKAAIEGEEYENTKMYPQFIEEAEKEEETTAKMSFHGANEVEKIHESLFKEGLNKLEKGEDLETKQYFVCQVCGYPVTEKAPEKCPICGASQKDFSMID